MSHLSQLDPSAIQSVRYPTSYDTTSQYATITHDDNYDMDEKDSIQLPKKKRRPMDDEPMDEMDDEMEDLEEFASHGILKSTVVGDGEDEEDEDFPGEELLKHYERKHRDDYDNEEDDEPNHHVIHAFDIYGNPIPSFEHPNMGYEMDVKPFKKSRHRSHRKHHRHRDRELQSIDRFMRDEICQLYEIDNEQTIPTDTNLFTYKDDRQLFNDLLLVNGGQMENQIIDCATKHYNIVLPYRILEKEIPPRKNVLPSLIESAKRNIAIVPVCSFDQLCDDLENYVQTNRFQNEEQLQQQQEEEDEVDDDDDDDDVVNEEIESIHETHPYHPSRRVMENNENIPQHHIHHSIPLQPPPHSYHYSNYPGARIPLQHHHQIINRSHFEDENQDDDNENERNHPMMEHHRKQELIPNHPHESNFHPNRYSRQFDGQEMNVQYRPREHVRFQHPPPPNNYVPRHSFVNDEDDDEDNDPIGNEKHKKLYMDMNQSNRIHDNDERIIMR
ncbi:hypothetical protein SNEBB_003543 [Seison nebaliae]|nr:hypothetical protein SNEBB_003543 [Seison nebaliae]